MLTFGELVRRNSERWGNHAAYVSFERRVTWREFHDRTEAIAHGLTSMGVRPGDRVAMLAADCIEVAELFIACSKVGALRVGINARLAPREIAHILDDATPTHVFVEARYQDLLQSSFAWSRHQPELIGFGQAHGFRDDLEDIVRRNRSSGSFAAVYHPNVMLAYTTGSTGLPKGAVYPHEPMLRSTMYIALCEGAHHDDVWLHAMPAGGIPIMHMLRGVFHGATTAIVGAWEPEAALTMIERERTTITVLVPTMLSSLLGSGLVSNFDTSSMRLLGYGASPLPPAAIRDSIAAFGCPFLQMYGTTELMGMSMMLYPSDHARGLEGRPEILSTAGKLLPYVDGRIVDEDGADVAPGEIGELILKTEFVIPAYWNAPDKYAETVKDGWLFTGDMAHQDDEGYIYLGDRAKFRMKTGGYNVFPTEVENAVAEHPAVHEVCVVGLPDQTWGERIHAVVVINEGHSLTLDELKTFCADRIATYKIPKSLDIWDEIPKGATGKILKRQVIETYLQPNSD